MYVVTPSEMRQIDNRAIEEFHIPGIVLMENAALQTTQIIMKHYPKPAKVLVLAGCGNNGGDALAVARHLYLSGYQTEVVIVSADGKKPKGDAATNLKVLESLKSQQENKKTYISRDNPTDSYLDIHWMREDACLEKLLPTLKDADFIVEGLFGTGLDRPISGLYKDIIELVNNKGLNFNGIEKARVNSYISFIDLSNRLSKTHIPVVSIDIPSGINGETGQVMGTAFHAAHTVTYGYLKTGHLLYPGREYSGEVHVVPISLPTDSPQSAGAEQFTLGDWEAAQLLKLRPRNSHKGNFGKVAVIAGSTGMTGAACLTSLSAQRAGAGLVTLGIPKSLNPIMEQKLTEVMTFPIEDKGEGQLIAESMQDITELLKGKDVLAIGPGCGKSPGVFDVLRNILGRIDISIVMDADGLNHISKDMNLLKTHTAPVILTPHPGEMSRMTGRKVEDILSNPVEAATQAADKYGCVVLLKGAASVVAEPKGKVYINTSGNPGMAKGGSGDVLTGIIVALLAQGYTPYESAVLGCYIHGCAGDEAAKQLGETGMIAGDIIEAVPVVFKRLYSCKLGVCNSECGEE